MEASNYDILIQKLDQFTRKYYKNQLIRGLIYSVSAVVLFYTAITTMEYFGQFDPLPRTILFYSFILVSAGILGKWIALPLFKLNKLGKTISHEQAAEIIGKHFADIEDKLLNTLQLKKQFEAARPEQKALFEASIDQRISTLQPVPFTSAIDLRENRKYLKFAVPPLAILLVILFVNADIISDGTSRLLNHTETYAPKMPFTFVIKNNNLEVVEQDDFELQVKLKSDEAVPENVYIEVNGNQFKLSKENNVNFNYLFKNVQGNTTFKLMADGFYSSEYDLKTLPNPILLNFDIKLNYPSYLGKQTETVKNSGDLVVPAGTKISWGFNTKNTEQMRISFSDSSYELQQQAENYYAFQQQFFKSKTYAITTSNAFIGGRDSILYQVNVIPDLYPSINVEEKEDSLSTKRLYFRGDLSDDYGFKRLTFNYRRTDTEQEGAGELQTFDISVNTNTNQEQFFHFWDLTKFDITPGEEIEYYFEVWDNDGVNGSKSTRTQLKAFKAPTLQEISEKSEQQNEEIKEELEESIDDAQELRKNLSDLQKEMFDKKTLNWQDKQKIEDILKQQKELQKKLDNLKKENEKNNLEQQEYREVDENLIEKQKELEKLFEEIMTDEMKELFEELEKLLEQLDKNQVQEKLEEMSLDSKDMEKELDRTLELFKQLEYDQKLEEAIEKIDELAEKQEELAEDTKEKNASNEELEQRQEELNKEFEQVKEDLDALEKKNEELQNPNQELDTEQQEKDIQEQMEKSSEQLQNNKNKKASQSQKDAAQEMKEMSEQLQQMQAQQQQASNAEDMNALRALLENLIQLSFDEENLMQDLQGLSAKDPKFVELGQQQKKLKDDAKVIEDSLFALSKRVVQLKTTINREISSINDNMDKALADMAERRTGAATGRQQFVMTSLNNLALLLDEALQQMQNQMAQQMPGKGQCEKPGGNGKPMPMPSAGQMNKMQQQISQQIEELKKQLEQEGKGKEPGNKKGQGKKPGEGEGQGMGMGAGKSGKQPGMSEKLAKLAAQQEALRREMQRMGQEFK